MEIRGADQNREDDDQVHEAAAFMGDFAALYAETGG